MYCIRLALVVIFIVAAVGVAIIILFVQSMIRPLTQLSSTAHEVAMGNLNVPILPVVCEDEVGVVTRSFNQMLDSIRIHIKQQRESIEKQAQMKERELLMETHLKEAQLKYLQAQINPHFLFNCLNAGAQLAMLEDAERTGVFLEKMADFFRYNVRKMEDDALLWEEVDAVDNYIYILNVRFAGDTIMKKMWMRESGISGSKHDFAASGGKCRAAWNSRLYGNWENQNVHSQGWG